jgi:hypothetical protein
MFWDRTAYQIRADILKARIVKTFPIDCFAFNIECLDSIGLFDLEMSQYNAEELDYSLRMKNKTILISLGSFVHVNRTGIPRNWHQLLTKYTEEEINQMFDEARFDANVAIGLSQHPIKNEEINLTPVVFRNKFDIQDFFLNKYLNLSKQIPKETKKDLVIAMCDKSIKRIRCSDMLSLTHTDSREAIAYIKNLVNRLNVNNMHA